MGTCGVPIKKLQIVQAIYAKKGIIMHAAASLGCEPKTIYNWMDKDEDVKFAVDDARAISAKERADMDEELVDLAYESIKDLMNKRDNTATIFTLKSKGKWCDRPEKSLESSVNNTYNVNYADPKQVLSKAVPASDS
jgi:hypothetical protein